MTRRLIRSLLGVLVLGLAHCNVGAEGEDASAHPIALHYAELAHATYLDSLIGAEALQREVLKFVNAPSDATLLAVRNAWINARKIYSQTEAFRFGNPNVDQWEGRVNAWPVDEGFIDYVTARYEYDIGNLHARLNFVASDIAIEPDSVRLRHEHGGIEANVATGFHAIEFLLWGQDLNEQSSGAGDRPYTDYLRATGCTNPPCARRASYLTAVAGLLATELREMAVEWEAEVGEYRRYFDGLSGEEKLRRILVGLGGMAGGELAGERLRVPLLASAQEDEQSCFSDTTHFDIYYNLVGIRNVYLGSYARSDGTLFKGPAFAEWVKANDPSLHEELMTQFDLADAEAAKIVERATGGQPFDQQILLEDSRSRSGIADLIGYLEAIAGAYDKALMKL